MRLSRKAKGIFLAAGALLCFALQMLIMKIPNGGNVQVAVGGNVSSINITGILQALMALVCVLLVLVDANIGLIIARVVLALSILSMTFTMIRTGGFAPLPGAVTVFLSLTSCEIIARQFKKMEFDSITDLVTKLLNRRGLIRELE